MVAAAANAITTNANMDVILVFMMREIGGPSIATRSPGWLGFCVGVGGILGRGGIYGTAGTIVPEVGGGGLAVMGSGNTLAASSLCSAMSCWLISC